MNGYASVRNGAGGVANLTVGTSFRSRTCGQQKERTDRQRIQGRRRERRVRERRERRKGKGKIKRREKEEEEI